MCSAVIMGDEATRLADELKHLQGSMSSQLYKPVMPMSKASEEIVKYTQGHEEPFSPDFDKNNPWIGKSGGGGGGGGGGGCVIL